MLGVVSNYIRLPRTFCIKLNTTYIYPRPLLTSCLYSRAVRVSKSNQCRLDQLSKEDIFTNQHELGVTVAPPLTVGGHCHVCVLDHAVDWDHQTWHNETERASYSACVQLVVAQVLAALHNAFFYPRQSFYFI